MQFVRLHKKQIIFNTLLVVFLCVISTRSYGNAINFFFWKDDWIYLWAHKYYHGPFFISLDSSWPVRTGLLMPLFVYLFKFISDSYWIRLIGLILKMINVVISLLFVQSITKRKSAGIFAGFMTASSSWALDVYGWHLITGLVVMFVMIGFLFYNKFLEQRKKWQYLLLAFLFFLLTFSAYLGRGMGILPITLLWALLYSLLNRALLKNWKLIVGNIIVCILFVAVLKPFFPSSSGVFAQYLTDAVHNYNNYFISIGNLARNPFFFIDETGGLSGFNPISLYLGYGLGVVGLIAFMLFIKFRNRFLFLFVIGVAWTFAFYLFNWIFGGGGSSAILGSTHRYLAVSSLGLILIYAIIFDKLYQLHRLFAVILFGIFLIITLRYADKIVAYEYTVKGRSVVEPVYKTIAQTEKLARVLAIENNGNLKPNLVLWSGPYPYAYYRNIPSTDKFPTVIPMLDIAVAWVCADLPEKTRLESTYGFINYQPIKDVPIPQDTIYAWKLADNGMLEDKTLDIRSRIQECLSKKKKSQTEENL